MPKARWCFVTFGFCIVMSGCASDSLYKTWGNQLAEMSKQNAKTEDVSMLIGTQPTDCEQIKTEEASIGINFDPNVTVIKIRPNGPAQKSGIRKGDKVIGLNNETIVNLDQLREAVNSNIQVDVPLKFVTTRGTFEMIPKMPKVEQCYWELRAGQVAQSRSGVYVNQYGGAGGAGSSAYQRFFKASCRVYDGYIFQCNANWQE